MLTGMQLPPTRHIPGSGTAPDHVFFAAIKAQCPARVADANWREVPPYLYGFDLYAAGYFWEAHEVWEPVWMACAPNSRERQLTAGLIQLANACLKLEMGRLNAARRRSLPPTASPIDGSIIASDCTASFVPSNVNPRLTAAMIATKPASSHHIRCRTSHIGPNSSAAHDQPSRTRSRSRPADR